MAQAIKILGSSQNKLWRICEKAALWLWLLCVGEFKYETNKYATIIKYESRNNMNIKLKCINDCTFYFPLGFTSDLLDVKKGDIMEASICDSGVKFKINGVYSGAYRMSDVDREFIPLIEEVIHADKVFFNKINK